MSSVIRNCCSITRVVSPFTNTPKGQLIAQTRHHNMGRVMFNFFKIVMTFFCLKVNGCFWAQVNGTFIREEDPSAINMPRESLQHHPTHLRHSFLVIYIRRFPGSHLCVSFITFCVVLLGMPTSTEHLRADFFGDRSVDVSRIWACSKWDSVWSLFWHIKNTTYCKRFIFPFSQNPWCLCLLSKMLKKRMPDVWKFLFGPM